MGGLKRVLGYPSLVFYGVGMILGAGIYSVIGAAAAEAGRGLWLSFLVSGLVVLLTALSYAELATLFPKAGAEFVYLRKAFPSRERLAFVTASLVALSGIATAATVSLAFAGYLGTFVSAPGWLVSLLVLTGAAGLAVLGIRESGWVNALFTLIEAGGLCLVIYFGVGAPKFAEGITEFPGGGVLAASALVFFSFLGFENIANLAEEAKSPERTLPRAILTSVIVSTTLYVLVGLSVVALMPPQQLAASSSPLASALSSRAPGASKALAAIALFATANTALISLIASSRVLLALAREKEIPALFSRTLPKRKTPWAATGLAFALAVLLLPLGDVEAVASVSSLASLLAFACVHGALIALRRRSPRRARPFEVKPSVGKVPVVPVVALACVAALFTQFKPLVYAVGGGALGVLALFHWWRKR